MAEKTKNLREKFGCLGNYMNDGQQRKPGNHLFPLLTCREYRAPDIQNFGFVNSSIYLSSYLLIIYFFLFIQSFRSNQRIVA